MQLGRQQAHQGEVWGWLEVGEVIHSVNNAVQNEWHLPETSWQVIS